ncbi:AbrB family transcriptional regulator [Phormidesmis priestleyi]
MQDKLLNAPSFARLHLILLGLELILAFIIGVCFVALGSGGGAWILGGIVAGAVLFYGYRHYNPQAQPNRNSRKVGQILVGLTIGFSIQHSHLSELSFQLPVFAALTIFLLLCGGLIGYLYSRLEKIDILTAILATVPGNIGVMASIAADHGGNTALVSLVQLARFTTIIFVVPVIVNVPNSHSVAQIVSSLMDKLFTFDANYLFLLFLLSSITAIAVYLGKKIKLPVSAFLCSILVGLSFNSLPIVSSDDFALPPLVNLVGQMLLGLTIGEYWGINSKLKKRTIAYAAIPVSLTFLAGFLTAALATVLTDWDWLTCLLVASPGGSPEMILVALALHHNVEIVTAGHLVRLLTINLLLPVMIAIATHLDRRFAKLQDPKIQDNGTTSEPLT